MGKYFVNPELKKSSIILLFINCIFLITTLAIIKINNDNLKEGYIKSIGVITEKINEKNPELLQYIIPSVTKEAQTKDAESGIKILKQYGLTKDLEDRLFPYVNKAILNNIYCIIILFFIMSALLFLINYFEYAYFYERIRKITKAAKKVIEGQYDIAIDEDKEGDFSKLANSFNSMKGVIRNNIDSLNKEKQFLVNLLSDISHQLKTPLSSMILYNDILLTKELSKEKRQLFLENNKKQLYRMDWLIKSILKLARLDARAIEFSKESISLNETIENSIDALREKAGEAKVSVIFKKTDDINFEHDRRWMEEAFINIIKNDIEHTPGGGEIKIDIIENSIYVRIEIVDTGEGISKADLPNVFKRFYKAKNSSSNSVGIGLSLSKSIIEAHNGIIEVQSKLKIGSKFIITFLKY
ncbi:HAMP domain-containing sensor histidine kinase [Clostridium guangxiense]|uniref:HAMP domain-containing sensor histidine kinase n=2 Tax=Clostridium TaxID=1485 RepID=UPI001E5B6949|nr:HAMP domain-containing sensor histidine kinase [Clostridium guangxiense]MCD2345545.1 HAMP domain-containing histidine kinase [Clostridium guangxiense]